MKAFRLSSEVTKVTKVAINVMKFSDRVKITEFDEVNGKTTDERQRMEESQSEEPQD